MILLSKGEIPLFIKPNLVFAIAATLLLPLPAFAQSTSGDKEAEPHNLPYSINRAEPATAPPDKIPKQDSAEPQGAKHSDGSKESNNNNQQPQEPKAAEWRSKVAVVPGALENERGELLVKIMDAQKQGVNIVTYLTACKDIEGLVKAGSSTEVIRTRIDSIEHSLNDQLSRKDVLKNKGPTPMDKRHPKILAPGQVVPPEWRWQPHY